MKAEQHERFDEWLSRGFARGNYANAYETQDYAKALKTSLKTPKMPRELVSSYRAAFTLGFFGTYELHEMGGHEQAYVQAYRSEAGQRCLALGYLDANPEISSD